MLHPIDYRLSKNKFWLSTWNSYSLKNYKNLILNDKILNILGYIFKNCFKVSYSFASPWSNPRKYRKYFSNFIIGFDGRRAIRTGPNKVKKLPGFIIPEDYNIIRFNNFSILKIYFLIDKNLETHWTRKQKNWRAPLKYFNMRYNKNKNAEDNLLKLNRNLINNNIEKKNFKITSFFIYLINLLNNNSIKQHLYLNISEQINFFKKDKKYLYFKFYYDNFKLLSKIRNNYFLFYLLKQNNTLKLNKLGFIKDKTKIINKNLLNSIYFKNINKTNFSYNNKNNNVEFLSKINYNDFFKFKKFSSLNFIYKKNNLNIYKNVLRNNFYKFNSSIIKRQNFKTYLLFNKFKYKYNLNPIKLNNYIVKNIKLNFFNLSKKYIIDNSIKKFYFNTNKKFGIGLFFQNSTSFKEPIQHNKVSLKYNKFNNLLLNNYFNKSTINLNLQSYIFNNRFINLYFKKNLNLIVNKQSYTNYKYYLQFLKNKKKIKKDLLSFKKIINFNKYNFSYNCKNLDTNFFNFQNFLSILYLNNFKKIKNLTFKYKKINTNINSFFINSLYTFNNSFNNFNINKKKLLIKKTIYLNLLNKKLNYNRINQKKKKIFLIARTSFLFNRNNWGKTFLSTMDFKVKNNYFYDIKNVSHFDSKQISKNTLNKIEEYDSFLKIKNFYNKGLNLHSNKNFNIDNKILDIYKLNNSNNIIYKNNFNYLNLNNNTSQLKNISKFKSYLTSKYYLYLGKEFQLVNLFNLSYKKTFSKFIKQQEIYTRDDMVKINYRLENLNNKKFSRLKKFKPYSFRSISKNYRYKLNKFILTSYIFNNIKKKYILNFLNSMENKKFMIYTNKKNLFKAKNTTLINNITESNFFKSKIIHYSLNTFNKKLKTLLFLNKKIQNKDSSVFLSKYKSKNFMLNYLILVGLKNDYSNYLEKLKFDYFKSQRNLKSNNSLYNNLYVKSYNSLLYTKSFYNSYSSFNYINNFVLNFEKSLSKRINYSYKKINNVYKYKLNIYKYFTSNNRIKLKQFYLPFYWNNKVSTILPLIFKKNSLLDNQKFIYNRSNNLDINEYIKTRLFDIFWSKKKLNKFIKANKIKSDNFNYRIYGLTKKLSDVKPLNKKDFKKIDIFKPKTFLYWKHLKWFNLFIKNKFNFKFNSYHNSYSIFKLYENFKNLNFYHYKNCKQSHNNKNYNSYSSFKYNYNKLNNITFYSTLLRSKNNFIYKNSYINKDFLLSTWSHDIMFSSSFSKRLNYIPHLRFKPIKDSIFMWRLYLRKLNLLSKYYKARTKFYKNKINFISNYNTRANIINYLKVMESNFIRIRKSMQRELPLIHTKRYLLTQFKKLNSYIKVLLRRQKRRLNYEIKKQKLGFFKKDINIKKKNYITNNSIKETEVLSKKLYTFVAKRFFLGKKNFIDYVKNFIEHLFLVIFKFDNLRLFYIKKYQINIMSTKAKLFKNLFNYRLATGFKIPFLVKVICKKLNFDKSLVGCKIGFFGRYSKKLRNRKIWKYVKHLKPSVISTPLDYYNILILQKWGITGIKLSILKKKTFNFIFNN